MAAPVMAGSDPDQMSQRILPWILCGLSVLSGASGCRVSGTSLQMDSDHRTPILGLRLAPRNKKAPKHERTIRQIGGSENRSIDPQRPAGEPLPQRSAWSRLLGRFGTPKRIPLPRTDIRSDNNAPSNSRD